MNPNEIIKEHIGELRDVYFVSKIGVFGSFARGEATEESDVDILVEFDRRVDLFHFIELQDRLAEILGRKVDLVTPKALKPLIKDRILREVLYV
ncbi:MAG TPA: nucleotidyltransferase family protein [Syntrophomonadaceae bacterium]|nr:nucleotidyltransferase family protein [Syntrophomonadaceae bacterium]HNX29060.1 nucleotidyltransferase family protein [Syntrophomonadaceae bacterium]HPR92767.1 nucleotidyltransferase family protein [Syntrophomonadaceae bacterium]